MNNAKFGYWYMQFLWMCYLITHLYGLIRMTKLQGAKLAYLKDFVWMTFIVILFKVIGSKSEEWGNLVGATWMYRMYPFFFIGVIIRRDCLFEKVFGIGKQRWFDVAGVAYVVFLTLVMTLFANHFSLTDTAAPFAIYVVVWLFYKYRNTSHKVKKILETMGKQSLSIYLFHYFILKSFSLTFIPYEFIEQNQLLMTSIAIIVSVVITQMCILLAWLARQNRILSFLLLGIYRQEQHDEK